MSIAVAKLIPVINSIMLKICGDAPNQFVQVSLRLYLMGFEPFNGALLDRSVALIVLFNVQSIITFSHREEIHVQ